MIHHAVFIFCSVRNSDRKTPSLAGGRGTASVMDDVTSLGTFVERESEFDDR